MTHEQQTTFAELLHKALNEPGKISSAYRAFHGYSIGNQWLAMIQCMERGIAPGPIATFKRWNDLGRHVMRGQKAIELCMPVTCKRTDVDSETGEDVTYTFKRFVFRRNWFVLAQTDGKEYVAADLPAWNEATALAALEITRVSFDLMDGNTQGYAFERNVAINPVAQHPERTLFHEIAHIVLGHTTESRMEDGSVLTRGEKELEAEGVAMLVSAALSLPGFEESAGYMQHWFGAGRSVDEKTAQRIFKVADQILRAGLPAKQDMEAA